MRGYSLILLGLSVLVFAGWIVASDGLISRDGQLSHLRLSWFRTLLGIRRLSASIAPPTTMRSKCV